MHPDEQGRLATLSATVHSPALAPYKDARIHQGPTGVWLILRDESGVQGERRLSAEAFDNLLHDAKRLAGEPAAATVAPKATVHALRPTTPGQAA